jgi:hypothetical protein
MKNRPQRQISFLVVWLTMFSSYAVWGQKPFQKGQKTDFLQLHFPGGPFNSLHPNSPVYENLMIFDSPSLNEARAGISNHIEMNPVVSAGWPATGLYVQSPNLYYLQSGYFCKREWEFEKATRIPLRIRLGSLADCNMLEGKH